MSSWRVRGLKCYNFNPLTLHELIGYFIILVVSIILYQNPVVSVGVVLCRF
jgi:hypothetical protein